MHYTINIGTADINVISNATDASNVIDCSEFSPDEADVDNNIYSSEFDSTQPKSSDLHRTGCSGDPCKNGGQCYPLSPMEYRCSCLTGYTGNNCETEMYICDQRPCQNQGVCKGNNTHYSCDCPLGYTGYNCEQGENEEVIALRVLDQFVQWAYILARTDTKRRWTRTGLHLPNTAKRISAVQL
nr:unnamed protein product [Callosobruchus chinensis]